METKLFCTADVSSDVSNRLNKAIESTGRRIGEARLNQLREVQAKIEGLKRRGLLVRQEFGKAEPSDFRRLFFKKN
ncbi:MAG TPA: hypothetical protein VMD27_13440 [Candidatus Aquilonibacter sp.]|nr:hypothetical protein [Candidatus Aquilonibacter sp.]